MRSFVVVSVTIQTDNHQALTRKRSFTSTATNNTNTTHNHAMGASVHSQYHIALLDWALGDLHLCAMRGKATASHFDAAESARLDNVFEGQTSYLWE